MNGDLITFFINEWQKYQKSSDVLFKACEHLSRWITKEINGGRTDIHEVKELMFIAWRDGYFQRFNKQVCNFYFLLLFEFTNI